MRDEFDRVLDRFGFLQFLDARFTQPENPAEYFVIVDTDPWRWTRRVSPRQRRNTGQAMMVNFTPRLRVGFDNVAAGAQVDVVKQVFTR